MASKMISITEWLRIVADINDITIEDVVHDLHENNLGPAASGMPAKLDPTFPLQGMLWFFQKRPFFTMTGEFAAAQTAEDLMTDNGLIEGLVRAWHCKRRRIRLGSAHAQHPDLREKPCKPVH